MSNSFEKLTREQSIQEIEDIENNFDDISLHVLFDKLILLALKLDEDTDFQVSFHNVSRDLFNAKILNDKSQITRGSLYLKTK